MKFLVDNQLPSALARFLVSQGLDCKHVLEVGLGEATDVEIWGYASRNDCVVISKDEDFLHLANARLSEARLVWIRLGNCRTTVLLAAIKRSWPRIEAALTAGDQVVEIR